jgi:hypothetical protein
MVKKLSFCLCLLISKSSSAKGIFDVGYFTFLQSNSKTISAEKYINANYTPQPHTVPLFNLGQTIWFIVKEGQPVLNHQNEKATALPAQAKNWTELENWKPLKIMPFQIIYKNLYGQNVIELNYDIILLYGGEYKKEGRYIGMATAVAKNIQVAFMYQLDVKVEVLSVHQMPTYLKPVGEIIFNISWQVQNPLKNEIKSETYVLNGFGEIVKF